MNFSYHENGQPKSSLVKLRVCPKCAYRLHYRKIKSAKEAAKAAKAARRASKSAKVSVPGEVKVSKKRKSFSETSERGSSGSESDADSEEKSATQVHKKSVIHDGQSVDPLAEWLPNQEVPSVQLAAQQSEAFAAGLFFSLLLCFLHLFMSIFPILRPSIISQAWCDAIVESKQRCKCDTGRVARF